MKRSDAINNISIQLMQIVDDFYPPGTSVQHMKKYAEVLLDEIQYMGMIPPIEPGRTEYDLDLGIPEWEPEDNP